MPSTTPSPSRPAAVAPPGTVAFEPLEGALAFRVAALLASYPDDDVRVRLRSALAGFGAGAGALPGMPPAAVRLAVDEEFADAVRSEYIDVFDRSRQRNPLYESEYGIGIGKGNELADVAAFYQAFNLAMGQGRPDMPDSLAVELEFYSVLLLKASALAEGGDGEGLAIVDDAQRKFLHDHLGRLAPAVAARPDVLASAEVGEQFAWCGSLVQAECARLGVVPERLVLRSERAATDDVTCDPAVAKRLPVVS